MQGLQLPHGLGSHSSVGEGRQTGESVGSVCLLASRTRDLRSSACKGLSVLLDAENTHRDHCLQEPAKTPTKAVLEARAAPASKAEGFPGEVTVELSLPWLAGSESPSGWNSERGRD